MRGMKFMARNVTSSDKAQEPENSTRWNLNNPQSRRKGVKIELDHCFLSFMEHSGMGRKSYNSFNKEIEVSFKLL